jgi:5-(carboxyamino)imidazole ribonucleotide mutase
MKKEEKVLVGIIMGSNSDYAVMQHAALTLEMLNVPFEVRVMSAHRTPDLVSDYAAMAEGRGLEVIIAGAGCSAHLPGAVAAKTLLPVLGVPLAASTLGGLESLLSISQMPSGVPVATFAIGKAGAINAALAAAQICSLNRPELREKLRNQRKDAADKITASSNVAL